MLGAHVFYLFLLAVAAVGGALYLLLIMNAVPGFREQRYGKLEPLPADLGQWELEPEGTAGEGERRETRFLFEEGGLMTAGKLVRQVRFRDVNTNAICRVLPDEPIKRRRVRAHE